MENKVNISGKSADRLNETGDRLLGVRFSMIIDIIERNEDIDMEPIQTLEDLISAGKLSEALDFVEALSQEERQRWQIQNLMGIMCAHCGQSAQARTLFEAAMAQQPNDPEVLYNLADTYAVLGMNRRALEMLERCEQNSDNGELNSFVAGLRQQLKEQKGGRVLMAAYYFPPLSGSGVFRSIKFAKYLPQFGWEPTVISTDQPPNGWNFADASQLKEIPAGMQVVRIPDKISTGRETSMNVGRIKGLLNLLHGVLRFSPEAEQIFSQAVKSEEAIMQLLMFPCSALSWVYDVIQYIEKNMNPDEFQAIYTTSGPYSAHLIGFYLKQRYGIPWVADYRDPWTFNAYNAADYDPSNVMDRLLYELEKVLLHQADCNLTIGSSFIPAYVEQFHLPQEKMVSITNGYDEDDFAALHVPQTRTDKFTINYSGLLYSQQRSIAPLLEAIQQLRDEKKLDLSKIRFRIIGKFESGKMEVAGQYGLESIIDYKGYLSHQEALQANLDANLLLLLVGDEPKFKSVYTGKLFEYLRSGRPILALAPEGSVVDETLRESGHGEAYLSTQLSEIKAMILREYRKWEQGDIPELLHSPSIEQFERRALTEQLAGVLSAVVSSCGSRQGDLTDWNLMGFMPGGGYTQCTDLNQVSELFLQKNYYYVWLKAMLGKAAEVEGPNATLITGSSYGLNGIIESYWEQAVNCSSSSQDLYYDFKCARRAISSGRPNRFSKCFIIGGYYLAGHDISRGRQEREMMISNVHYPIFADGHNWVEAKQNDLWAGLDVFSDEDKRQCEQLAIQKMLKRGTFFSEGKKRGGTIFKLKRDWWDLSAEERQMLGKIRAEGHNKMFQKTQAISENIKILNEYVHFLHLNGIMPIVIIAPVAPEYRQHVSKEMKESINELVTAVSEEFCFVDFNQFGCFEPSDFVDTDHLSLKGAEKFSNLLINLFKK